MAKNIFSRSSEGGRYGYVFEKYGIFFVFLQRKHCIKKMLLRRYITLMLCLLPCITAFAQEAKKETFLIVSRPQFREGLQLFVQWKRQEGFEVEELYVDTNSCFLVKEMMRPLFDSTNVHVSMPQYILLVGDHEQLEAFHGSMPMNGESHFTDLPYADFMGDYLPETMLGRWPVNDTAELRIVVEKTLRYEQFVDMDTAQLQRILLVAGREYGAPAPTTTNGQVNYLKREVKCAHPEMDTLCWYNPASDSLGAAIASAIGQGACLLNYTGHGIVDGWSHPMMNANAIATLEAIQPTIYVNNCCQSNTFTGTGFGEQLLRMPVGGAVGVIGATNSTLWAEDYYWSVGPKNPFSLEPVFDSAAPGAFDGLVRSGRTTATLGELLRNGNMAVMASGTNYAKYYWEIYCLLGDPSLKPWIGVPQPMMLVVDSVEIGQREVSVECTPGARITVVQGDELLGVVDIGDLGRATIELWRAIDTLPLVVTATGINLEPRVVTIPLSTGIGIGRIECGELGIEVFPNPSHGRVYLLSHEKMTVYVTNALGRCVGTLLLLGDETVEWRAPEGLYFATGITDKGTVTQKIIIK